ncbi:MAG: hypothetical protein ABI718_10700 [Acidobacteriota bacterium]
MSKRPSIDQKSWSSTASRLVTRFFAVIPLVVILALIKIQSLNGVVGWSSGHNSSVGIDTRPISGHGVENVVNIRTLFRKGLRIIALPALFQIASLGSLVARKRVHVARSIADLGFYWLAVNCAAP